MPDTTTDKPNSHKRERSRKDAHGEQKQKGLRYKGGGDDHKRKKHKRKHGHEVPNEDDEDMWIEKNIDGEAVCL